MRGQGTEVVAVAPAAVSLSTSQNKRREPGETERRGGRWGEMESRIIGSEPRRRSALSRQHSLNLKRRCGVMKMWPLINIRVAAVAAAKQVGLVGTRRPTHKNSKVKVIIRE